jgi:hypothetical protein
MGFAEIGAQGIMPETLGGENITQRLIAPFVR